MPKTVSFSRVQAVILLEIRADHDLVYIRLYPIQPSVGRSSTVASLMIVTKI